VNKKKNTRKRTQETEHRTPEEINCKKQNIETQETKHGNKAKQIKHRNRRTEYEEF
jgi:hypothetical protein